MLILVEQDFDDLKHGKARRKRGELLEVSDKRAKEIIGKGYAKKIKIIDLLPKKEEVKKEVKEVKEEEK